MNKHILHDQTAYITKRLDPEGMEFSGTLTFTSITEDSYKGTFSFTAYIVSNSLNDSLVVKDGKFEIYSRGRKW